MLNKYFWIKLLIVVCIILAPTTPTSPIKHQLSRVVLDAGHGGHDPGAIGIKKKVKEKDIALKVVLALGKKIKASMPGVEVIYTRTTDKFIHIYDRGQMSNMRKADAFISIHCNACKRPSIYGIEIYTLGLKTSCKNLEVAKRENEVILLEKDYKQHYHGFDPRSPDSHILFMLSQNASNAQSVLLAHNMEKQFKKSNKRRVLGVKQGNFLVLWRTNAPSVLVEIGFLTNENEEKFLRSPEGIDYIASEICSGLQAYSRSLSSPLND